MALSGFHAQPTNFATSEGEAKVFGEITDNGTYIVFDVSYVQYNNTDTLVGRSSDYVRERNHQYVRLAVMRNTIIALVTGAVIMTFTVTRQSNIYYELTRSLAKGTTYAAPRMVTILVFVLH